MIHWEDQIKQFSFDCDFICFTLKHRKKKIKQSIEQIMLHLKNSPQLLTQEKRQRATSEVVIAAKITQVNDAVHLMLLLTMKYVFKIHGSCYLAKEVLNQIVVMK